MKTIMIFVPNHALGHAVESARLGLAMSNFYNLIFVAEQRAGDLLKNYGFKVITLPERDMFSNGNGVFFDGYIEDVVRGLIHSIKPHLIISNHPCFTFAISDECKQLGIPHIGIYGQFSQKMMIYLARACDIVISTVPQCFSYFDSPKVKFVGPFIPEEPSEFQITDIMLENLFNKKIILVCMGGGGYRSETSYMLNTVNKLAALKPAYNFLCIGEDDVMKFNSMENVYKLGTIHPEVMAFLEKNCFVGIVRAGKTTIELASYCKPLIALSLPSKNEQIQRCLSLANAGGAEYIKYEELNISNLLNSFEKIEQNYQNYAKMLASLDIHSGLPLAIQLITTYLKPDQQRFMGLGRMYPFSLGVIEIQEDDEKTVLIARYYGQDSQNDDLHKNWSDIEFAKLFITPDWLLLHSPYLLRRKLGCSPEERTNFSRPISIYQKRILDDEFYSTGIINNKTYNSQYQINQREHYLKLEIQS